MSTSRCAYCGDLAENPVELSVVVRAEAGRGRRKATLRLCLACSQSWCMQPAHTTQGRERELSLHEVEGTVLGKGEG